MGGDTKSFIEVGIDYCRANAPLEKDLFSDDVGSSAVCLLSPLFGAITGVTLYVDNGMHAMGMVQEKPVEQCPVEAPRLKTHTYTHMCRQHSHHTQRENK